MINFSKCPNCNVSLIKDGYNFPSEYKCSQCDLKLFRNEYDAKQSYFHKPLGNYWIYWQSTGAKITRMNDFKSIYLDYIPFNITLGQLKLFLTFS